MQFTGHELFGPEGEPIPSVAQDCSVQFQRPLAVDLAGFSAEADGQGLAVRWETVSEDDILGFNVYRALSPDGPPVRREPGAYPGEHPGSSLGASGQWLDTDVIAGTPYYYWLEVAALDGTEPLQGPVSAVALWAECSNPRRPAGDSSRFGIAGWPAHIRRPVGCRTGSFPDSAGEGSTMTAGSAGRRDDVADMLSGAPGWLFAGLLLAAVFAGSTSAAPGAPALVRPDPLTTSAPAGSTLVVSLYVQDVSGLYSADLLLEFDPAILQVVDIDPAWPACKFSLSTSCLSRTS